tara:strand:- start:198 stop:503 length:306 start_codon:yes stop_codon:yes gene_type:complete
MKTFEYYSVNRNSDQTEGRGHSIPVASFLHKIDARTLSEDTEFCKKHGIMGSSQGIHVSSETITIYESVESYKKLNGLEHLKRMALAKLTDQDKILLGLVE